jgi:hypothetical protein
MDEVLAGKVRFMDTIIDVKQTHFRPEKPVTGEGLFRLCSTLWDAAVKEYNVKVFDEEEKLGRA